MNWRTIDLNLLVVFDAVAQTRGVTRAATRLNMTQTAISHALTRLRRALHDELFVRTPEGMAPTPYAESLAGPIRAALDGLGAALDGAAPFDPATADRRFVLGLDNRATLVLACNIVCMAAREAPGITLDMRATGSIDVAEQLDRSELDVAIGSLAAPGDRFSDLHLFDTGYAVLMRRGHPAADRCDLAALAAYPHLDLSSTGEPTGFLDTALAAAGLSRHVAVRAPLLSAPAILSGTDMLAVLGERTAQAFAAFAPLHLAALPVASPRLTRAMLWHRRYEAVPAHQWLRALIVRIARAA